MLVTQAALLVPQYVLAEVTLSFLGLGVAEPARELGQHARRRSSSTTCMVSYWWMWIPGLALVPVFLAYHALADALRARAWTLG